MIKHAKGIDFKLPSSFDEPFNQLGENWMQQGNECFSNKHAIITKVVGNLNKYVKCSSNFVEKTASQINQHGFSSMIMANYPW